ncbi:unnamed protein product [Victoria cruziana]
MDDLRIFHVYNGTFKGYPRFPKRLKWLGLPNCKHVPDIVPTDAATIPSDDLVVLDLYNNDHVADLASTVKKSHADIF